MSSQNVNPTAHQARDQLIDLLTVRTLPLGYRVIFLEILTGRQKILRLYIEHADSSLVSTKIGIEDCAIVSREIDEYLDELPEVNELFPSGYELEVSSPGLFRPLRTQEDFLRFTGERARLHTFRPLSAEELENADYFLKFPKQKNYFGNIVSVRDKKVVITVSNPNPTRKKKSQKISDSAGTLEENDGITIAIPLNLVSKANLEPEIHFGESDERE